MEKLLEQEAMEQDDQKVKHAVCGYLHTPYSPAKDSDICVRIEIWVDIIRFGGDFHLFLFTC